MNFLTNFSLILSFGIAIDTIIVIVQAASMKLRIGYDPKTAIALALREYAIPIISGVSTTIVVFIPMMVLPGIMGKFLAYIPVTIFGVLASGLIFALTINSALYLLMVRPKKTYIENDGLLEYASREEKELLALERIGKTPITEEKVGIRTRILFALIQRYRKTLSYFLSKAYLRKIAIFSPLVFFMFGIMFLMPRLGFELFPADDNNIMTFSITGPVGTHTESMHAMIGDLTPIFANIPEIDRTSVVTTGNQVSGTIELIDKNTRKSLGQRDLFTLETIIADRLKPLLSKGLKVSTDTLSQ